jgi:hypothetical protein
LILSFVAIGAIPFMLLGSQLLFVESLESSIFLGAFLGLGAAVPRPRQVGAIGQERGIGD